LIVSHQLADAQAKAIDPQRVITDVGIDELSLKKRHKLYATILTDLTNPEQPEVLAVADGRDEAAARKCLENLTETQRQQVRTYRADMALAFHNACRDLLPKAKAVVDRFHVAKKFNEAIDDQRKKKGLPLLGATPEKFVRLPRSQERWLHHENSLFSREKLAFSLYQPNLSFAPKNGRPYYGDANPTFTGTITGLQNGDAITASSGPGGDVTTSVNVTGNRDTLSLGNIDKNFRRFLWQARISHGGRGHGPRVHDLRHTFAVNNLRGWFARGDDVGALLPVLQAYMGHASPDDTAYYLRLTAESYPHITAQVRRVVGDVVPPVTGGPGHGD